MLCGGALNPFPLIASTLDWPKLESELISVLPISMHCNYGERGQNGSNSKKG